MSGTGSGSVAVGGESALGGRSLPVNVLGSGSGGASSSGQVSACAGIERPSLFSDSGSGLPVFNPFAALWHHWIQQNDMNLSIWELLSF